MIRRGPISLKVLWVTIVTAFLALGGPEASYAQEGNGREHGPAWRRGAGPKAAGAAGLAELPLRRVERRARTEEAGALAPSLEHSSAIAPPSAAPRRLGAKAAPAPEIVALAESLGRSPGRIFRFVHDGIDFEPQLGAGAPPAGTLQEGRGTSWEQAWLLQDLLIAAGVDARLEWGEVEVSPAVLQDLTGVADVFRAGDLLTTGGVRVVLVVQGGQVVSARLPHVWVKAHLDYVPNRGATPGAGDTWVRMDPSLKRYDEAYGTRVDDAVPFLLGDYLLSGTESSPRAVYEAALADHTAGQDLEDLKPRRSVTEEAFPFVPGTLRARIVSVAGEAEAIPADKQQRLTLQVIANADGASLLSWSGTAPQVWGRRLEIAWPGATAADQATLDLYGGVYSTPPYEVDLKPSLRLDGVEVAAGARIGSAEDVELRATITPPDGVETFALWEMFAGEHGVVSLAFGGVPRQVVDRFAERQAAATSPAEEEAWGLARAAASYLHALAGDSRHLAALRWHRVSILGAAVLAVQRGAVSTAPDGSPVTFAPGPLSIDVGAMPLALVPAEGPQVSTVPTMELLGSQGSVREGEALAEAFGGEHVTAVGFLTRAVRAGQTLTRVDAANLEAALAEAELSAEAEGAVRFGTGRGLIAWIPRAQIEIGGWQTTGYVLENPASGAGAYLVTFERRVPEGVTAVEFHSPLDLAQVTAPTEVIATIRAGNLKTWSLATRPAGESGTTVLATGTGPVENAVLGKLDPTLLLNGLHDLVLTGTTEAGTTVTGRISVIVEGDLKIGNFTLPFLDLEVPILGVPIQVIRTYDSRDKGEGDFGYGWTLSLNDVRLRENVPPGVDWKGTTSGGPLPNYCIVPTRPHIVSIAFPAGEVYRFRPTLEPGCQFIVPPQIVRIRYVALGTTRGQLEALDQDDQSLVVGSFPGVVSLWNQNDTEVHDAERYRLTTTDGRVFVIHERDGVQTITDANGNTVTFTANGISHSLGVSVAIERDARGRITRIEDPENNALTYTYDANGDLASVKDLTGSTTTFTYFANHFLHEIIDGQGNKVLAAEYDGDGRAIRNCDAGNNCVRMVHDLAANQEKQIDATGRSRTYTYDATGNVIEVADDLGNTHRFRYDEVGNVLEQVDPNGARTTYTYDTRGNRLSVTSPYPAGDDPAGHTVRFTYDAANRRTAVILPTGGETRYTYDAKGNLTEVRDEAGRLLESYSFGPNGELTSRSSVYGTTAYGDFDAQKRPRRMVDPNGIETTLSYNANGHLTGLVVGGTIAKTFDVDATGRVERADYRSGVYGEYGYRPGDATWTELRSWNGEGSIKRQLDPNGRLTAWVNPDGSSSTFQRDAVGRLTKQVDPAGREAVYEYDAGGRMTAVADGEGRRVRFTLDAAGRVQEQTDPLNNKTTFTYEPDGRIKTINAPLGRTWSFDSSPGSAVTIDPLGRPTRLVLSEHGDPIQQIHPDGTSLRTTYLETATPDERHLFPTSFVDEGGRTRSYSYDGLGALAQSTDLAGNPYTQSYAFRPDGITSTWRGPTGEAVLTEDYDSFKLASKTWADGGVTRFTYGAGTLNVTLPSGITVQETYDASGRPVQRTSSTGESSSLTWNAAGDLTGLADASGTTTYQYDRAGRLTAMSTSANGSIEYARDEMGRVAEVRMRGSASSPVHAARYVYDAAGRLDSLTDPLDGTTRFEYDLADRLIRRTLPNGVVTEYTYDDRDQVTGVVHKDAGGAVLASVGYERQPGGEPSEITREDGSSVALSYDTALRLTEEELRDASGTPVETVSYTYDTAGNRLSRADASGTRSYAYQPGYQVVGSTSPAGNESFTWDADGRVRTITRPGSTLTLTYDSQDNLTSAADGSVTTSYTCDALGRRVKAASSAGGERRFLVAPALGEGLESTHMVMDGAGNLVAGYVYAGDRPLMRFGPSGPVYYLTDANGSTIALADAAGAVAARFEYDGFGQIRSASGPLQDPPAGAGGDFRFHGLWLEEATGLYHVRARDYDPQTGRFMSRDAADPNPLTPESLHPYLFAFANPYVYSDPTGLFTMMEMNVTLGVQGNLRGKEMFKVALKQYIQDKVEEAVQELLIETALDLVGLYLGSPALLLADEASSFWLQVERGYQNMFCQVLGNLAPQFLWFEPVITERGKPLTDGWRCGESAPPLPSFPAGQRRPDLLFTRGKPTKPSPKAFAAGEIKASMGTFYSRYVTPGLQHGQYKAMRNYAFKKGFPPHFVLLLSFSNGATQAEWVQLQQLAIEGGRPNALILFAISGGYKKIR